MTKKTILQVTEAPTVQDKTFVPLIFNETLIFSQAMGQTTTWMQKIGWTVTQWWYLLIGMNVWVLSFAAPGSQGFSKESIWKIWTIYPNTITLTSLGLSWHLTQTLEFLLEWTARPLRFQLDSLFAKREQACCLYPGEHASIILWPTANTAL